MQIRADIDNRLKDCQHMLRDYERRLNVLKEQVIQGIPTDLEEILSVANGIYELGDFIDMHSRLLE